MKRWTKPEISVLEISATEHKWLGNQRDGGYIGDGEISGHLKWECGGSDKPADKPGIEPENPTEALI